MSGVEKLLAQKKAMAEQPPLLSSIIPTDEAWAKDQAEHGGKLTELYHGTASDYEKMNYPGGVSSFSTEPGVASQYAQGAGGGRKRLGPFSKYLFSTDEDVAYELRRNSPPPLPGTKEHWRDLDADFHPVGRFGDAMLRNKESLIPFEEGEKKPNIIQMDDVLESEESKTGEFDHSPKRSRIIKKVFKNLDVLDTENPKHLEIIASIKPKTKWGEVFINSAKKDLADDRGLNKPWDFSRSFWAQGTKYAKTTPHIAEAIQKDIVNPLKAMGFDGIKHYDDTGKTTALFDTAESKQLFEKEYRNPIPTKSGRLPMVSAGLSGIKAITGAGAAYKQGGLSGVVENAMESLSPSGKTPEGEDVSLWQAVKRLRLKPKKEYQGI